jgi:hypothetical protein
MQVKGEYDHMKEKWVKGEVHLTSKDEMQTSLFKVPVRTAQ